MIYKHDIWQFRLVYMWSIYPGGEDCFIFPSHSDIMRIYGCKLSCERWWMQLKSKCMPNIYYSSGMRNSVP